MQFLSKVLTPLKAGRKLMWRSNLVLVLVLAPLLALVSFVALPTPGALATPIVRGPFPIDIPAGATGGSHVRADINYTIYQPGDTVGNSNICPLASGNSGSPGTEPAGRWCYTFTLTNENSSFSDGTPITNFKSSLSAGVTFYSIGYDHSGTNRKPDQPDPNGYGIAGTPAPTPASPVTLSSNTSTYFHFELAPSEIQKGESSTTLYYEANFPPGLGNGTFSDSVGDSGNGLLPGFSPQLAVISAFTQAPYTVDISNQPNSSSHHEYVLRVIPGGPAYTYTIYFTNPAPTGGNTLTCVKVTDVLPTGVTAVTSQAATYANGNGGPAPTPSASSGTCPNPTSESIGAKTQTFKAYDIPPGGQLAITFSATADLADAPGSIYYIKPTSTIDGILGPQAYDVPDTVPSPNPTNGCDVSNPGNINDCSILTNGGHNGNDHTTAAPVYVNYANGVSGGLQASSSSFNLQAAVGATSSVQQNLTLSSGAETTNWTSSISYGAGATGWLGLNVSSGTVLAGNTLPLTISANPKDLAAGTYTANVTFADVSQASNSITVTVKLVVGNGGTYSYYLPFLANNAGGFSTKLVIQNAGKVAANLTTQFYDQQGSGISTQATNTIAANASYTAANPFASGSQGTGVITSDQPLSVLVNETTQYGGSAYAVTAGANNNLVAPLAINGALGFKTQLTVANVGNSATTATIRFYDQSGNEVNAASKTLPLAVHTAQTLDQTAASSNLPADFYGWAQISSATGSQLVAQVLEQRPDSKFIALANAQVAASNKLYAPAIFNNAFGGFSTGANIVNPNSSPVQINVSYYDNTGKAYTSAPFTLAAHGVAPVYQGGNSAGLPTGFYGSATVSSQGGNIVMVVNEAGNTTASGAAQSGTYAAAAEGSASLGLPIVANNAAGYTSGVTVLNVGDSSVDVTISYYHTDGSSAGTANYSIAAHASQPIYQGGVGLATGFVGQAVVSQTSGPTNSLLSTTNVQSNNLFYSYTEPSA